MTALEDDVLAGIGELVAAAKNDWDNADPGDIGLNGVVIKQWREGYFEGVKDMAHHIVNRLPKAQQEEAGAKITAAFKAEGEKLKELNEAQP